MTEQQTPSEKVAWWMMQNGYATGHGDTTDDMLAELEGHVRERCARIADTEAAEYRRQLDESNKSIMRGGSDHIENARLHGRLHTAENIAALIRLPTAEYAKFFTKGALLDR